MAEPTISAHTQIRKTKKRGRLLLLFFGTALTFNAGALFFRALDFNQNAASDGIIEVGPLYPKRETIFSADKIPLAWSENVFELLVNRNDFEQLQSQVDALNAPVLPLLRRMTDAATPRPHEEDPDLIIAVDALTVRQLELLAKHTPLPDSWRVNVRPIRKTVPIDKIREKIGAITIDGQKIAGFSGWEKEFDQQLAGTPGEYQAFCNSMRTLIPKTFQIVKHPVKGQPVILPWTYRELGGESTDGAMQ